jgi:hypothetical protein
VLVSGQLSCSETGGNNGFESELASCQLAFVLKTFVRTTKPKTMNYRDTCSAVSNSRNANKSSSLLGLCDAAIHAAVQFPGTPEPSGKPSGLPRACGPRNDGAGHFFRAGRISSLLCRSLPIIIRGAASRVARTHFHRANR